MGHGPVGSRGRPADLAKRSWALARGWRSTRSGGLTMRSTRARGCLASLDAEAAVRGGKTRDLQRRGREAAARNRRGQADPATGAPDLTGGGMEETGDEAWGGIHGAVN